MTNLMANRIGRARYSRRYIRQNVPGYSSKGDATVSARRAACVIISIDLSHVKDINAGLEPGESSGLRHSESLSALKFWLRLVLFTESIPANRKQTIICWILAKREANSEFICAIVAAPCVPSSSWMTWKKNSYQESYCLCSVYWTFKLQCSGLEQIIDLPVSTRQADACAWQQKTIRTKLDNNTWFHFCFLLVSFTFFQS